MTLKRGTLRDTSMETSNWLLVAILLVLILILVGVWAS